MDQQFMRTMESICIQNEPPACVTACPLHVDSRTMLKLVASGKFEDAYSLYQKNVPFPSILSKICNSPCLSKCRLSEIGEGIQIRPIEAFLNQYADPSFLPKVLPEKRQKAGIFGSELDSLSAAYDLRRKGYQVTILDADAVLAKNLRAFNEEVLPSVEIENAIHLLEKIGVKIQTDFEMPRFEELSHNDSDFFRIGDSEFQCIYLPPLSGELSIDSITHMTVTEGIFSGSASAGHWVDQMSDGRRAAISMDRYLQKVSLTASRENEGAYECRLFTSLKGIQPSESFISTDIKRTGQADIIKEAARCIQCQCLECAKGCEFIRHYQDSPRTYVRQIYNNISICTGLRQKNKMINSCSMCGQCEAICPNHIPFQKVVREARETMVATKKMPPSAFDFALRDMAFSNSEKFRLAKVPVDSKACKYAFFPGCQLPASNPSAIETIFSWLRDEMNEPVGILLRCCGAIADWAGEKEKFNQARSELLADWESLGKPELIVSCPTCLKMFREKYPEINVRSIWPLMAESDSLFNGKSRLNSIKMAIHDPCASRDQPDMQEAVRSLAMKLGIELEELPYNRELATCCSYGGNVWNSNPSLSRDTVEARISQNQSDYLTYCIMCRDFFLRSGKPAYHILDILFDPKLIIEHRLPIRPDYSMRHENRTRVKRHLLKQYWREEMPEEAPYEDIQLILNDPIRKLMEDRMILEEDIRQVLYHAKESGRAMINQETGHYLAHFKPSCVTYWVEYLPKEDGFEIFNVYSHRMFVEEGNI